MFVKIIQFGLITIPFILWSGYDTRAPKFILAAVCSLAIILYGIFNGIFKPYKNIWLLGFIAFLPFNYLLSPQITILVSGLVMASWILQAFFYVLIFFLAHIVISSYEFSDKDKDAVLHIIVWVGLSMAIYGILQRLGINQFFLCSKMYACGTLGNPGLFAPFIAMIVPIALFLRRYKNAAVMGFAVLYANSQIATGAAILSILFLISTKDKGIKYAVVGLTVVSVTITIFGYSKIKPYIGDSGRFNEWRQIVVDVNSPIVLEGSGPKTQYSFTGFGLGSFKYLYHNQHPKGEGREFLEAHNEYLELLYNTGLVGLFLFVMGVIHFIKECFPLDRLTAHLLTSFLCIAICAGGMFVWQNGAIIFYTLVITGMLASHNHNRCCTC